MRKIATLLFALAIGAGALPAIAMPGASGGVEQFAEADWIVMKGRDAATMYFAIGWRSVGDYGAVTIGAVGKGRCQVERSKHMTMISCEASGRGKELALDEFEFDPVLRSAEFSYKLKGERQSVRWRGLGRLPYSGGQVAGGDGFVAAGAGMAREARATARIFGKKLQTRGWMSFALLGQGAGAGVFTDYGRNLTVDPDGSFTYRVELQLPRRS